MMKNETFSLTRFFHVCTVPLHLHRQSIQTGLLTAIVILLVLPIPATYSAIVYTGLVYISGFIITSQLFSDLSRPLTPNSLLLLPCSNVERFWSRWLLATIGLLSVITIGYYLYSAIGVVVKNLIYTGPPAQHDVYFIVDTLGTVFNFLLLQQILIWGSLTFKKNWVMKNIMLTGCYWLLSVIVIAITYHWFILTVIDIHITPLAKDIISPLSRGGFLFIVIISPWALRLSYKKLCARTQ